MWRTFYCRWPTILTWHQELSADCRELFYNLCRASGSFGIEAEAVAPMEAQSSTTSTFRRRTFPTREHQLLYSRGALEASQTPPYLRVPQKQSQAAANPSRKACKPKIERATQSLPPTVQTAQPPAGGGVLHCDRACCPASRQVLKSLPTSRKWEFCRRFDNCALQTSGAGYHARPLVGLDVLQGFQDPQQPKHLSDFTASVPMSRLGDAKCQPRHVGAAKRLHGDVPDSQEYYGNLLVKHRFLTARDTWTIHSKPAFPGTKRCSG